VAPTGRIFIKFDVCVKIMFTLGTGHEGPDAEKRYSSTLSLTSALDGVGGQRHAPATLTPGKTRYPLYRRMGGPQGRSGQVQKISPPAGFDPRTVQPVQSLYTDHTNDISVFFENLSEKCKFSLKSDKEQRALHVKTYAHIELR
jgi:hypothetical protein